MTEQLDNQKKFLTRSISFVIAKPREFIIEVPDRGFLLAKQILDQILPSSLITGTFSRLGAIDCTRFFTA